MLEIEDENSPVRSFTDEENFDEPESTTYSQYSFSELKEMLDESIRNEDYEKASIIRDELRKRGK